MKSDYSKDMYRYVESLFAQVEELQEKIKGLERKTQYMEGMERELKTQELLINSLKEKNAHTEYHKWGSGNISRSPLRLLPKTV